MGRAIGWVLVLLVCGGAAKAETMTELYAKAKAEQTLVLYGGGPAANYEPFAREFERTFPGITVKVTGDYSNVLNAKVEQQLRDRKVEADLLLLQTVQDFVHWKARGVLLRFKPEGFETVDPAFKDKDGAWIAVNVSPLFYAYNTDKVAPRDVPRSALDFLDPKFRGKLITAYPSDDDATLYAFDTIVAKYGWDYMKRYMANQPNFVQGHLGVARAVAAGDDLVTFDATVSTVGYARKAAGKIATVASAADPTPVFMSSAAILAAAPHPNAAKLYLTWFLAAEQQRRTGFFSPRNDVMPPAGYRPLKSYRLANRYVQFVSDDKRIAALRKRFESLTGPVVNTAGVR